MRVLADREGLRQARERLLALRRARALDAEGLEALAECSFRLAAHRDTPKGEALQLLREAVRLDGTNPKYPYHLARLHFLRGEYEQAGDWLRQAACLCPTSHRVWAHIALLHRQLNGLFRGERYVADALKKRGDEVAELITQGKDNFPPALLDFTPPLSQGAAGHGDEGDGGRKPEAGAATKNRPLPPADVRRLRDAGSCRWSGVIDLAVEQLLEGKPSKGTMDGMLPLMEQVASRAASRRGGVAAFVALAAQWLVSGYPVRTVRRLAEGLPGGDCPSRRLLEKACALFEAPREGLAASLAAALDAGEITPLLAALIHRQRLLHHGFDLAPAHGTARRLLAGGQATDQKANDLIRRLSNWLAALHDAPPPLKDTPRKEARALSGLDAAGQFRALEQAATGLSEVANVAFRFLRDTLVAAAKNAASDEDYSRAVADREALGQVLASLLAAGEEGAQRLDEVVEGMAKLDEAQRPADFEAGKTTCKNNLSGLTNQGKFNSRLKQVDGSLAEHGKKFKAGPCAPSAELAALLEEAKRGAGAPAAAPQGPLEAFAELERAAEALDELRSRALGLLRKELEGPSKATDEATLGRALASRRAFDEILVAMKRAGEEGARRLAAAVDGLASLPEAQRPEGLEARKAECKNRLVALCTQGPITARLRKVDLSLAEAAGRLGGAAGAATGEAAPELAECALALRAFFPSQDAGPAEQQEEAQRPNPAKRLEGLTGREGLEDALAAFEVEVTGVLEKDVASFEAYPPRWRSSGPLAELLRHARARQAEVLFRLGRRHEARGVWAWLSREDRLDARLLRNLAVCDNYQPDVARRLGSWRSYLEMLYWLDVAAGSPRGHAASRAAFHRSYGGAFAPAFLSEKLGPEWARKLGRHAVLELVSFFNSPGRVKAFVDHTLHWFAEARLDFDSPSLVLGVSRTEGEEARRAASEAFLGFVGGLCPQLPPRVGAAYRRLVEAHLGRAREACREVRKLTGRAEPQYPQERDRLLHLLHRAWELKEKLFLVVMDRRVDGWAFSDRAVEIVKQMASPAFLAEMARLDELPLDASAELFAAAVPHVRPAEARTFVMDTFSKALVGCLMKFLLQEEGGASDEEARRRQYRRLVGEWMSHPALAPSLGAIDDPAAAYPGPVAAVLAGEPGASVPAALAGLKRIQEQYPELTGPGRWLAMLLQKAGRHAEAIAALSVACEKGAYRQGALLCRTQRLFARHNFATVLANDKKTAEAMGELDGADADAAYLIDHAEGDARKQGHLGRMWCGLMLGNLAAEAKEQQQSGEGLRRALGSADWLVDNPAGVTGEEAEQARYVRMLVWYRQAAAASERQEPGELKRCLKRCAEEADWLLRHATDDQHRQSAEQIQGQVGPALKNLS